MSSKNSTESACSICCDEFTKSVKAPVQCPACSLVACRICVRRYLLNTTELPHCMNCKNRWERDFLMQATLKSYVNGEYKVHRTQLLFDQEKARIPETMEAVENYRKINSLREENYSLYATIEVLKKQLRQAKDTVEINKDNIYRFQNGKGASKASPSAFRRKCGSENCQGFLSSAWKCAACEEWTCPACFEVLGKQKDCGHVCDPSDVESARLIKKSTKPCPSCATPIFKIDGCDQMWCTQCHVAFSWKTGRQVNGVVHNPHFYEWQKNGGGAGGVVQVPNAQVCGGLPPAWNFRRELCCNITGDRHRGTKLVYMVLELHRGATHFEHYELVRLREACQDVTDNKQLRIKYIMKEIDEKKFKSQIMSRDKLRQKRHALLQVYELVNTVFVESIRDIAHVSATVEGEMSVRKFGKGKLELLTTCSRNLERCHKVRIYANKELAKISDMYNQKVGLIGPKFGTYKRKIKLGKTTEDPPEDAEFIFFKYGFEVLRELLAEEQAAVSSCTSTCAAS